MANNEEDPFLFNVPARHDSVQDIIDNDLRQLHQFFVYPILGYIDSHDSKPFCKSGDEIPLLPSYFAKPNSNPVHHNSTNHAAGRSAELFLADWGAEKVNQYKDKLISITDWRISDEGTGRQEFVRIRWLKSDARQQTRAFIYYDEPPRMPRDFTRQRRVAAVIKKIRKLHNK